MTTLPVVIEKQCSDTINDTLLAAAVVGNILWLVCGFMLKDEWILVPNVVGLLLNLVVVAAVLKYPKSDKGGKKAGALDWSMLLGSQSSKPHESDWVYRLPGASSFHRQASNDSGVDRFSEAENGGLLLSQHEDSDAETAGSYGALGEAGGTCGDMGGTGY